MKTVWILFVEKKKKKKTDFFHIFLLIKASSEGWTFLRELDGSSPNPQTLRDTTF